MNITDADIKSVNTANVESINLTITGHDPELVVLFLESVTAPVLRLDVRDTRIDWYVAALVKSCVRMLSIKTKHPSDQLSGSLLKIPHLVSVDFMSYVGNITRFLRESCVMQLGFIAADTYCYACVKNDNVLRVTVREYPNLTSFNKWIAKSNVRILTVLCGGFSNAAITAIDRSRISKLIVNPHVVDLLTVAKLVKSCADVKEIQDFAGEKLNFGYY